MKGFIFFILGWFTAFLFFAFICYLCNLESMNYKQCLADSNVQICALVFGWIFGIVAAVNTVKDC